MFHEKKKVVIIGGGFAGSYCASKLEKKFNVTLIDTKNYFEFTPSILRVIVDTENLKRIQARHFDYLKKTKIVLGEARKIFDGKVFVGNMSFDYDYLIISSGSSYKAPFKSKNMILLRRGNEIRKYHKDVSKAKKIIIVGGGLVGVELASEIIEEYPRKKISVIQSPDCLVPRNNKKTSEICKEFLEEKGVEIVLNKIFKKKSSKDDLVFFCTGITPNCEFVEGGIKNDKFLRLKGKKNVFVAGDVAGLKEEKTAQNALEHAKVVVKNIKRLDKGRELKEYHSKKRLFLISLGPKKGILEYKNFVWYGRIPAIMKNRIERRHMRKMRR